jgi:chromate transporter
MSHDAIPFREALGVWVRVALQSFGGPAGQVAVMHRILVDEKRWISERRFLHALNYCMLLPGPEAQQLATYVGWLLHGTRGGLLAGCLFVLPGFLAILALSILYAAYQQVALVEALFFGLKAAVLAVVVEAVLKIGRRVLKNGLMVALAALAFVAIFFFGVPFPLLIVGAGLLGMVGQRVRPELFVAPAPHSPQGSAAGTEAVDTRLDARAAAPPRVGATLRTAALWLAIWLIPVALVLATLGDAHVFSRIGTFFSTAALVTFGGAYAVLAYIAQQAVETYHWLTPAEMLDGLGMAETTPGPLIQVVQFVGFMAAWRDSGGLSPLTAGFLAAVLTTWVTFAPCFLWIFVGAPYIEALRGNQRLTAALSAITAAVVGVILNLAVWFAVHVVFAEVGEAHGPLGFRLLLPVWSTVDPAAVVIAALSFYALLRLRLGMLLTLLGAAAIGTIWKLLVAP